MASLKNIDLIARKRASNARPSRSAFGAKMPMPPSGPLPRGSGFDRLVKRVADTNNLPGKQNHFGETVLNKRTLNTRVGNPRQGQEYQTSRLGNKIIHTYKYGNNTKRVVLPTKTAKFRKY